MQEENNLRQKSGAAMQLVRSSVQPFCAKTRSLQNAKFLTQTIDGSTARRSFSGCSSLSNALVQTQPEKFC
jgi:hypothetical protein